LRESASDELVGMKDVEELFFVFVVVFEIFVKELVVSRILAFDWSDSLDLRAALFG
jgi:hypothetical protein